MSVPVTHRIVEINGQGRQANFVTKGDANEEADKAFVPVYKVLGKVVVTMPYVGFVIDFARTRNGFLLLVGIPALLIILDEFANITWEIHKYRYTRRKRQNKVSARTMVKDKPSSAGAKDVDSTHKQPISAVSRADRMILDLRHYQDNRSSI